MRNLPRILSFSLSILVAWIAQAASPPSGTVNAEHPVANWDGTLLPPTAASTCGSDDNPSCDNYSLTIEDPGYAFQVKITLTMGAADDWDLEVYGPDHTLVASSGNGPGSPEVATLTTPAPGVYTVSASPYAPVSAYQGTAELSAVDSGGSGGGGTESLHFRIYAPVGLTEPDPHWDEFAPTSGDTNIGQSAGEPTLGVPVANNLALQDTEPLHSRTMYLASLQTLRLETDRVVSPAIGNWLDKSSPTHVTSLDPILEVDQFTGRTISTQLAGNRSIMSLSDDDGDTWTDSPEGGGINSGVDHQTVGAGVFPASDPIGGINGYPDATYYASQDIALAQAALSRDGGLTWGPAVPMYNLNDCGGLHGHAQVSPDTGSVFVPNKSCGSEAGLARSDDAGTTWQVIQVPGIGASSSDPAIGVGSDGTAYYGQCGQNNAAALVSVSHSNGDSGSWSSPINVGAALGIQNCVFPTVVAGDGDRAAFAFLGSVTPGAAGTGADPTAFDGVWYLFVAVTYDAGVTWTTVNVTPDDPVQKGPICLAGTTCAGNRNLLDFIDIQKDELGRILVAFADGCTGSCVTGGPNSGTAYTRVARQEPGSRSLYAVDDSEFAPNSPVAPLQPYLEAVQSGNQMQAQVTVNWATPWNGESPLTGYRVYRRTDPGSYSEVPIANVDSDTRSYIDTDVQAGTQYCYKVQAVNSVDASPIAYESCAVEQPVVDPCTPPGALRGEDPIGDQMGTPNLDYQKLFLGEPFLGDPQVCNASSPQKLVFTMKIGDPSTVAAGNAWIILWNRAFPDDGCDATGTQTCDREMVNARATGPGTIQCNVGEITAPSVNQGLDQATLDAEDCALRPDGTLTISVPTGLISDCEGSGCSIGPGYELAGLEVRVFNSNVSGDTVSQATASDDGPALSYQLIGNDACRADARPSANDDVYVVDLDRTDIVLDPLVNDSANDCDAITITAVSPATHGTVSIGDNGTTVTYHRTDPAVCEDHFTYTITDSHGKTAQALVTLQHDQQDGAAPGDYVFASGFDGGHVCPNLGPGED